MRVFAGQASRCVALAAVSMVMLGACSGPAPSSRHVAAAEPAGDASVKRLRILTEAQYLNTIAYVFGPDFKPVTSFPPSQRTDGLLTAGTSRGGVTTQQLELYQKAAATVAAMAVDKAHRTYLVNCKPQNVAAPDKACAAQFLAEKGRLLTRRPLSAAELDAFVAEAGKAADKLQDFYAGLGVALEGMLVGPDVLFVAEKSEPDPRHPGGERLDAFSLATRLSLFLWNAAPDDSVLKAAESGEIQTAKGRARIVDMMLASRRVETGARAFFDDMFGFDDFNVLSKDPTVYPKFNGQMMADAREETLRTVVDQLVVKTRDYRDLFTTHDTFISPAVAVVYGLKAPPAWSPYTFPDDAPRAGVLTQISFLAVHAHPGRSSPTLRGKAVREILLCQPVPPPPPNVDFSALEDPKSPFKTVRERINFHQKNPACAGCHKIMDPLGLALENFDGVGRYRDTEKGAPIDTSGALDGKPFKNVAELGHVLHDHPALTSCLVKRAYAYGTGGPTTPGDRDKLEYFNTRFAAGGYTLPALLKAVALSNAFSEVGGAKAKTVQAADAAGSK